MDSRRPAGPPPPPGVGTPGRVAWVGRPLVPARVGAPDSEVRLPRTAAEAATNVRYFAAQGYRVVVAGRLAATAADAAGVDAARAPDLTSALAAVRS